MLFADKRIQEYENKVEELDKERNLVVEEMKGYQDRLAHQENQTRILQKKDADSQASIKSLTRQLGKKIKRCEDNRI